MRPLWVGALRSIHQPLILGTLSRQFFMADLLARKITMGYEGGSITAAVGVLRAIFGNDLAGKVEYSTKTINRGSHQRTRVIGGNPTSVQGAQYQLVKYPQGAMAGARGGEAIKILADGDWWTVRLSGSHQAFNKFLAEAEWGSGNQILWKSAKGKPYGPFSSNTPALVIP